ncbi:hypothetical protein QJQ45_022762 [Haematococcus lacustris]|nr:hypothetical protein QJQ45_022762 [Haematococcus lacustris]
MSVCNAVSEKLDLIKKLRREVADLLREGDTDMAWRRVESVVREEMMDMAWDRLELYLKAVEGRAHQLVKEAVVPSDIMAAVSSIIFAAHRLPDFEELQKLQALFSKQYKQGFVEQVINPETHEAWEVSRDMIRWLRLEGPDYSDKQAALASIAHEAGLAWDPSTLAHALSPATAPLSPHQPWVVAMEQGRGSGSGQPAPGPPHAHAPSGGVTFQPPGVTQTGQHGLEGWPEGGGLGLGPGPQGGAQPGSEQQLAQAWLATQQQQHQQQQHQLLQQQQQQLLLQQQLQRLAWQQQAAGSNPGGGSIDQDQALSSRLEHQQQGRAGSGPPEGAAGTLVPRKITGPALPPFSASVSVQAHGNRSP